MVSTELLRRYPFFATLTDDQLRELAMISSEREYEQGETLFEAGENANSIFLLRQGSIEIYYIVRDERGMEKTQDHLVGIINPWEVFGISAAIDPFEYAASAVAGDKSLVIEIDGQALRTICDQDLELKALIQERIAATAYKRLQEARIQLLVT